MPGAVLDQPSAVRYDWNRAPGARSFSTLDAIQNSVQAVVF